MGNRLIEPHHTPTGCGLTTMESGAGAFTGRVIFTFNSRIMGLGSIYLEFGS